MTRRCRWIVSVMMSLLAVGCDADPGHKGRSSADWISQLVELDVERRVDAADALAKVLALQPNAPKVIAALVRTLADTSDVVRVAAAVALRNAASGGDKARTQLAREAVPGVAALLADSAHVEVRRHAAQVLGEFGASAASVTVPPLATALRDPAPDVRLAAASALAGLGPAARPVVPRLLEAARDPDRRVRASVARTLAESEESSNRIGNALVQALGDSDAVVREAVAIGLGKRGMKGLRQLATMTGVESAPLTALRGATRDPVSAVRLAAVTSLGLLGDSASLPTLRRALADPDTAVRREAAHALSARHRRGDPDPAPREPSRFELCRSNPRWPGC